MVRAAISGLTTGRGRGRLIDITGVTCTTYLGVLRHARVSDAGNL